MKQGNIRYFALIFLIMTIVSCSNPQEEARIKLAEMKVAYSPDTFVKAARARDVEMVKLFLQAGMDPNVLNKHGEIALLGAARDGAQDVVALLLEKGARVEVKGRMTGITPLIWAATSGSIGIVTLLLDHGADLEARESGQGVDALMAAANNGKTQIAFLLLERGANINVRDNYNRTALIWAAQYGRADTVQALLEKGADTTVKEKIKGQNALLVASARGKTETVKVLLEKGEDLNARDHEGKTPLMLAALGGWPETVKLLLERNVDPNARDKEGNTALSLAQAYRHADIAGILKKSGASGQPVSKVTAGYVQKIIITGKITHEESGYYIQGRQPREIYIIHNPNPQVLETLAQNAKTVVIDARIVLGDNVAIEKIDGKNYQGEGESKSE